MFGAQSIRFVRRRMRVVAVWAALPLVVFNGQTVVGCGCTGHFEAVCRFGCCAKTENRNEQHARADRSCCASQVATGSKCPCCDQGKFAQRSIHTPESTSSPASGQTLERHRCRSIAVRVVTPVTIAQSVDVDGLHSLCTLVDLSVPVLCDHSPVGLAVDFDTGPPPNDLVVTLHRLVI